MTINRRAALALGAMGAVGSLAAGATPAAAQAVPASNVSFYRFKIGDSIVTAINDGVFSRPLEGFIRNAAMDDIRAAQAEAFQPTDRVTISVSSLVIQTGGKLVLLDAGLGDNAPPTAGRWMANFRAAGFDPAQVDTVLVSHFHGDHIGGLRTRDGAPVFARAEVKVPTPEWDFWMDDARAAAAPDGLKPNFANVRRILGPMAKDVTRFEWGQEVAPGISAVAAPGHTPGHTVFALTSGGARLLVMSDTSNAPHLFVRNPDWAAVFDMDADAARTTRHKLLDMAASEKMQVSFYHAPFPATGFIARDGEKRYRMVPAMWMPAA
jgi:glyoxylase-like metal-dependent hydrolase (beta-lactamase superfamily II)